MPRHPAFVLGPALLLALPSLGMADFVGVPSSRDNTLMQTPDGSLSNGAGPNFFVGTIATGEIRRGLVYFDITSHVPAGATITGVSLTLHMSRTPATGEPVSVHRVQTEWGEGASVGFMGGGAGAPSEAGDATWIHAMYPDAFWSTPGGDFDPDPLTQTIVGGLGHYTWDSTPAFVSLAQSWLDGQSANHGLLLLGDESFEGTAKRFDSRENDDPALRPVLAVEFTPVPAPAGSIVLVLGLGVGGAARRRGHS